MLALVAALVAAVGPARSEHAEYAWPPETLPAATPTRGWYAPLPLLNRVPESIDLRVPCGLSPPLLGGRATTVVATSRRPEAAQALRIALDGASLDISVGGRHLAAVSWPGSCPLDVSVVRGEVRFSGRDIPLETTALDDMPIVTGLFTGLDLREGERPQALIRTRTFATSQTALQIAAGLLAVILACAALVLLAGLGRLEAARIALRSAGRRFRQGLGATDLVVVGTLLVWWVVAPTFTDDAWIWSEYRVLTETGTVGIYLDTWGLSAPLALWTWLGQWIVGATDHLVVARVPSLAALLAGWIVCRWCVREVVPDRGAPSLRWTLAGAFLVGAVAWGMTLRPEPFVSLLAVAALAAMASFARAPRLAPLAIVVPLVVLAATTHPTGIVVAAPLLAGAPEIFRALRLHARWLLVALGALLVAGLALTLVLLSLDADLGTRLADARLLRQGDRHREPFWHEHIRYLDLDRNGGDTAPRRLSLGLLVLVVVAWISKRRPDRTDVLTLPARSVAIGLALLAFLPSKWPWHFGALAAMCAVAVAAEVARLIDQHSAGKSRVRLVGAAVVFLGVAVWSWRAPGEWSPVDLGKLEWSDGLGVTSYGTLAVLLGLLAALGMRLRTLRHSREETDLWHLLVGWAVPAAALAVVGVTITLLAIDAALTPWSPARQNVEALAGRSSCGLAHQLRSDRDVASLLSDDEARTLLVPSVGLYFPCATIPAVEGGLVEIPDFVVYHSDPWPLRERDGPFAAVSDLYELKEIASNPDGVKVLSVTDEIRGFVLVDALRSDAG